MPSRHSLTVQVDPSLPGHVAVVINTPAGRTRGAHSALFLSIPRACCNSDAGQQACFDARHTKPVNASRRLLDIVPVMFYRHHPAERFSFRLN
jgi:hypothetical protein